MSRRLLPLVALAFAACPAQEPTDAGVDAGPPPLTCDSPEDCRVAGQDAVCRLGECRTDVPCGDDLECGLGERCLAGRCVFRGCLADADCASGKCLTDTFACAECGQASDCPPSRPVCDTASHACVGCLTDDDCDPPGPGHCSPAGACVHCLTTAHCPNGLACGATSHVCEGVAKYGACPTGTACAQGLTCVTLNADQLCLPTCDLYAPNCGSGEVCYKLTYAGATSLVFETTGPIGVCYQEQAGLRHLREACTRSAAGSNCEPNLQCVPENSGLALCRAFCNPYASGTCPASEKCVSFAGDFNGRRYGLCLPDTGFGLACTKDGDCRTGLSCQAYDDPSTYNDVSPLCQFNQGASNGLAPCGPRALADGGTLAADRVCKSGACKNDPLFPSGAGYFCYASCSSDADCSIDGRQGTCDGTFTLSSPFGASGSMKGCRPACQGESDCAAYDAGVACRLRLPGGATPALKTSCSPPPTSGSKRAGESCALNGECRSGLCQLDDGRGVARAGTCLETCRTLADCAAPDAGTPALPLSCAPAVLLGGRGTDGLANTADDVWLKPTLCAGSGCVTDQDCRPDGGVAVCVPVPDPVTPGPGRFVLACRPPARYGVSPGGASCATDAECASGVCGTLQAPATGTGKACLATCTPATACPGTSTCRDGGLLVPMAGTNVALDSCAD